MYRGNERGLTLKTALHSVQTIFLSLSIHLTKMKTFFVLNPLIIHCKVIIGRNPIEANTVAIQLPGNPAAYIGKCFTPY